VLKWLREKGCPWENIAFFGAILEGHLDVVKWIAANDGPGSHSTSKPRACKWAAFGGHLKVLKWLRKKHFEWDDEVCLAAAQSGNLVMVKWVHRFGDRHDDLCKLAAKLGDLEMLKWAVDRGYKWDNKSAGGGVDRDGGHVFYYESTTSIAKTGHLRVLKYARELGGVWHPKTTKHAVQRGDLRMLKWAIAEGCPWHPDSTRKALKKENLETLKWAIAHGCPWHPDTTRNALRQKNYEEVKWAIENGQPWPADTTFWLASPHGALHMLQWAVEHGCSWHPTTTATAAGRKKFEVLKWVVEHGRPWGGDVCSIIATRRKSIANHTEDNMNSAIQKTLEVFEWVILHGCIPTPETWTTVASNGDLELLHWAKEHQSANQLNLNIQQILDAAIAADKLEVVKWCFKEGAPLDEKSCLHAAEHQAVGVLKWLRKKRIPLPQEVMELGLSLAPQKYSCDSPAGGFGDVEVGC